MVARVLCLPQIRLYVLLHPLEGTHPRCEPRVARSGPGRASNKEGEPWNIIQKLLSVWTRRSCAMR